VDVYEARVQEEAFSLDPATQAAFIS